jgi:dTDP-glucose 4,6-dehydratase
MSRVLITGGSGFIGSHLADRFIAADWEVMVLDNLITSTTDNIAHLMGHPRFHFVHYDVTRYLFFAETIDLILHFACPASPVDYTRHPIHTMKVDSLGTLNTLGLARNKKARYVMASTSEIYGSPKEHPQRESYWGNVNPIGPRSVYDEAKRFSEAMCMAYFREYQLDIRIARIFNTYGERMRLADGRAIPNLITQGLRGEPMTITGDGSQTRSFCYISDLVDGLFELSVRPDLAGEVFNLGNPTEITILEMAETLNRLLPQPVPLVRVPALTDDPHRRRPEISKAASRLGFDPRIPLGEGLSHIIPWFSERIHD